MTILPTPTRLEFEITNYCNARCIFCPRFNIKEQGLMDLESYKKFVLKIKKIKKFFGTNNKNKYPVIVFGGYGEALIHPKIFDFIDFAKKNSFRTELISNGLLLNSKNCNLLDKAGLDKLSISLHTLNPIINKRITKHNINVIPTIKKALTFFDNKKNIKIELWRVADFDGENFSDNEKDNDYDKFLRSFNKKIRVLGPTPAWNRGGQFDSKYYPIVNDSYEIRCQTMFFTLSISYNGDIILCCCDFSKKSCVISKKWEFDYNKIQNKIIHYQKNLPIICLSCRRPRINLLNKLRNKIYEK